MCAPQPHFETVIGSLSACEPAASTLGVAVKYREDAERVKKALDEMLTT